MSVLPTEGLNKLCVLTNYVTPKIYESFAECATYDEAIQTLEALFVKPTNRYLLATSSPHVANTLVKLWMNIYRLLKRYSRRISRCRLTTSKRSPSNVPTAPEGHRTPTVTERWSSNSRTSKRETPCYRPLELIGLAAYSSSRTSLCESSVGEKS